jgi:ribosome-binding factor A
MARTAFNTRDKQEGIVRDALNVYLRQGLNDSRLQLVTVTKVILNQDYTHARVYWDTYDAGIKGDVKAAFGAAKGRLRTLLAKGLKLRQAPFLEFYYDGQFEAQKTIESILSESLAPANVLPNSAK